MPGFLGDEVLPDDSPSQASIGSQAFKVKHG